MASIPCILAVTNSCLYAFLSIGSDINSFSLVSGLMTGGMINFPIVNYLFLSSNIPSAPVYGV